MRGKHPHELGAIKLFMLMVLAALAYTGTAAWTPLLTYIKLKMTAREFVHTALVENPPPFAQLLTTIYATTQISLYRSDLLYVADKSGNRLEFTVELPIQLPILDKTVKHRFVITADAQPKSANSAVVQEGINKLDLIKKLQP